MIPMGFSLRESPWELKRYPQSLEKYRTPYGVQRSALTPMLSFRLGKQSLIEAQRSIRAAHLVTWLVLVVLPLNVRLGIKSRLAKGEITDPVATEPIRVQD